jgi:predicted ATPase with chaperone activity
VAPGAVTRLLPLGAEADAVWRELIADKQLTGRGATRIRRVARTLADLDDSAAITADHLETAAGLRGDVP